MADNTDEYLQWQYGNLNISYVLSADRAGHLVAKPFIDYLRKHLPYKMEKGFNWQSGAGFIGFSALAVEMCDEMVFADENTTAINCVKKNIKDNNFEFRAKYYLSRNFASMPSSEKFDLVIGTPPGFLKSNPEHPFGRTFIGNNVVQDNDWQLHRDFFETVSNHLDDGALIYFSAIEPFQTHVFLAENDPVVYDIRPEPPIQTFQRFIKDAGLTYVSAEPYYHFPDSTVTLYMISVEKKKKWWKLG